ncbi:(R)-mandelonitrile lyase [Alteromonas lipolytica]|nr:cupin domain-containing protein [Alteromonas lipolytica]GGF78224.1 cupin [Alteromonas lipolytica]
MRKTLSVIMLLMTGMAAAQAAGKMEITPNGAQKAITGSDKVFSGISVVTPLVSPNKDSNVSAANVTFAPGARSAWHTHPAGQFLVVSAGQGYVQEWGEPKKVIKAGDVVWTPPGVKHWHGATETTSMTHMAIQQLVEGKNVVWGEKVTDKQYHGE